MFLESQTMLNAGLDLTDERSPIVVCAADNNYAMQLTVVARSAIEHLERDRNLRLFIIDGGITEQNKAKIARSLDSNRCTLTWLKVDPESQIKGPTLRHVTAAAYLRLSIPELLPDSIQKAIYLDSDLIVHADLGKLWDMPLEDHSLLAVQDFKIPYVSSPNGLSNYQEIGLSPDCQYFNSGVLVFNLSDWRSRQLKQKMIAYIEQYGHLFHACDQEVLNAVLAGQWQALDPRWNQTPGIFQFATWQDSPFPERVFNQVITDPYIIHFATTAKPWNSQEFYPANDLFFQYVDQTAWAGWRFTRWRRLWRRVNREAKKFAPRSKAS